MLLELVEAEVLTVADALAVAAEPSATSFLAAGQVQELREFVEKALSSLPFVAAAQGQVDCLASDMF